MDIGSAGERGGCVPMERQEIEKHVRDKVAGLMKKFFN